MNCQETQENLEAFLDGESPRQVKKEIKAHLKVCPQCREGWLKAQEVKALLHSLPVERCPSSVERRIWAEIPLKREGSHWPLLRRIKIALAAGVFIAAAVVGIHYHYRPHPLYTPDQVAKGQAGVRLALAYYQHATQLSAQVIERETLIPLRNGFREAFKIFEKRRKL